MSKDMTAQPQERDIEREIADVIWTNSYHILKRRNADFLAGRIVHSLGDRRRAQPSPREVALEKALRGIVLVCGSTGDEFHDFEEQAEAFYKETGWMRPGKDMPAAGGDEKSDYRERRERFVAWINEKLDDARAALSPAQKGEPG